MLILKKKKEQKNLKPTNKSRKRQKEIKANNFEAGNVSATPAFC